MLSGAAPGISRADPLRIATFNAELSRKGSGLLLRDILKGDKQVEAAVGVIALAAPDVLVLTGIDYDLEGRTLAAFAARIAAQGHEMPHTFAARPNSGWMTDLDLDGDGRLRGPGDAQGWGRYAGDGGMAVLSRWPLGEVRDLSGLLWAGQGWALLPRVDGALFPSPAALEIQRLSSVAHWVVPVEAPGGRLDLLAFYAGPPVFDGPEISLSVPLAADGLSYDGVTAALRVNANLHAPLLCVTDVFDVASGDLSLPGRLD